MSLLLLGIVAASVTYEQALNPPGGFWQANATDGLHYYLAGDPVLHIKYPRRYLVFFFCNSTAFVASLVILILLLSNIFSVQGINYCALRVAMILDLLGLIGVYAAASCCLLEEESSVILQHTTAVRGPRDFRGEKFPNYLMLLASITAAVTYQATMNPPGGLWDDGQTGHIAGDPVLLSSYPRRYKAFFYCNLTSFVASLVVIVLLLIKCVRKAKPAILAVQTAMILNLFGLMGAYAAGSCRTVGTSAYFLALAMGVSAYIVVLSKRCCKMAEKSHG